MSSSHSASISARHASRLGTLSVITWTSDPSEGERNAPYLLAYSLGDGKDGAEAGEETMRTVLAEIGLIPGGDLVDVSKNPNVPITLLVEAGRAVLTMPYLNAQCPVPPEWERDARDHGQVYFIVATRPWAEATPGKPVTEEQLRAFAGDQAMLTSAAHCLVPVRRLRG
ncbi:DUF5949 family protein [Streptomyces scopuliridis]|uniref:DUF5949 family protein n=1 Tax=Streptomyces scopuliridis TaxID=452529 RepID=A0ACD4ZN24_9ACTN|nr:DUF5949 family protein [Streptomyces scopuliridis]WSB99598.1 DUF5949 family protein [Streptomyces scopuliridis]WSC06704.1 DUF5949 family protein [Streptomyces scopuliridis]